MQQRDVSQATETVYRTIGKALLQLSGQLDMLQEQDRHQEAAEGHPEGERNHQVLDELFSQSKYENKYVLKLFHNLFVADQSHFFMLTVIMYIYR
jgi:hypothetical protein